MDARNDPFTILVAKLAGIKTPPKARQAFQQFMHESYETEIALAVEVRFEAERNEIDGGAATTQRRPNAPFRAHVARELFAELPKEEQAALKERAAAEATEAKAMKSPPSKKPEDRQR